MRIRNLLIAILTVGSTVAVAQEQRQIKEEGKTVFKPHWFMQVQAGAAHTVGEADFTDLISPAAACNCCRGPSRRSWRPAPLTDNCPAYFSPTSGSPWNFLYPLHRCGVRHNNQYKRKHTPLPWSAPRHFPDSLQYPGSGQ